MPRLRRLSGAAVSRFFVSLGFEVVGRRGSHIKLRREAGGARQVLVVPDHAELDTGTCRAILRQAGRYVPDEQLRAFFYSD